MARIIFLQDIWYEHLGIMRMSAILKKNGHHCDVFIGNKKTLLRRAKVSSPDLIAFSCMTGNRNWALGLAQQIKEELDSKILTIMGGAHPTFSPEIISNPYLDIICRGEGEYAILELADRLDANEDISNIENLWVKKNGQIYKNNLRPLIQNLDELPFPDRTIYYKYRFLKNSQAKSFMAIRGCVFNCSFCYNHSLKKLYRGKGKYIRFRSVNNIIEELKLVKDKYGLKIVMFEDDSFTLNKSWLINFCKIYRKKVNVPFICQITSNIDDEEIIRDLKYAGCLAIYFGLESGNESYRINVLNKKFTDNQIINIARLLKKYGIKFCTANMFCLPGESVENAIKTVQLNHKIKAKYVKGAIFQPYPGTAISKYALKEGLINREDLAQIGWGCQRSLFIQKDAPRIINLCHLFYVAVKFPKLFPIIKRLIKLPPNRLYFLLYRFFDGYVYFRLTNMGLLRFFSEIKHHFKFHLDRGFKKR